MEYPTRGEVELECDLVMKGGITSGVVYPLAACELARTHRFRNIGGASAGAIAATLVAAAEFARDTGGFEKLALLPQDLGPDLPKLFKPGDRTRTAQAAVMAAVGPKTGGRSKARQVAGVLYRSQRGPFLRTTALGLVAGGGGALLLAGVPDDLVAALRFAALVVVFGALALVAAGARAVGREVRATASGLDAQGFGICVGSAGAAATPTTGADPGYLTDWLAARIDDVAGVEHPLTIGELEAAGIHLQVMTTNLTHARPMTFPFDSREYLFDPIELGAYFPPAVMAALTAGQTQATLNDTALATPAGAPLFRLPPRDQLPVVLAARISLSFPGLISAVPLWAVDFSRAAARDRRPIRCWFSDGGITSNFPIHFFDAMWPTRPTFALDLRGYQPDHPESDVLYTGAAPRQPRVTTITGMGSFVGAILNTMQYWSDDAQSTLPGYRDRIVEVHLHGDEGGMNLAMPAEVVERLAEKGRLGAQALLAGFDFDQHRWTRYLTTMARFQEEVERMGATYDEVLPGLDRTMLDVVGSGPTFAHYGHTKAWADRARARTETLLAFAGSSDPDFATDEPRPASTLRITPRY